MMKKALLESLQGSIHSFSSSKSRVFVKKALDLGADREGADIGFAVDGEGLSLYNVRTLQTEYIISYKTKIHLD